MIKGHILHGEVIAAFLKAPRTVEGLMAYVGITRTSADGIVKAYRLAGVLRQAGVLAPPTGGRPARLFALQKTPFAEPDVLK